MDSIWYGTPQTNSSGALSSRSSSDSGCKDRSDTDVSTQAPLFRDHADSSGDEWMPAWPLSPLEAQANAIRAEEEEHASSRFNLRADTEAGQDVLEQMQRKHIIK